MANPSRISIKTRQMVQVIPSPFQNLIHQVAEGSNLHVQFPFTEVKVIRGTEPHPPSSDVQEVRNSITLQFNGTARGPVVAHLFNDGSIRTSAEMHQENNRRRAEDQKLTAEESKFPELQQTDIRRQAAARMTARIRAARTNTTWSVMQKQLEKDSAEQEYRMVLRRRAQDRAARRQSRAGSRG